MVSGLNIIKYKADYLRMPYTDNTHSLIHVLQYENKQHHNISLSAVKCDISLWTPCSNDTSRLSGNPTTARDRRLRNEFSMMFMACLG